MAVEGAIDGTSYEQCRACRDERIIELQALTHILLTGEYRWPKRR